MPKCSKSPQLISLSGNFRILCKNCELPQQILCYVIRCLPLLALSHPTLNNAQRRRGEPFLHYATFSCSNIIINCVWKYGWRRLVRWCAVQRVAEWKIDFFSHVTFSCCVHKFAASSSSSALTIHFEQHKIDRKMMLTTQLSEGTDTCSAYFLPFGFTHILPLPRLISLDF